MKIAVAGIGYVGMSNAVLLAQHNSVVAVDLSAEKVALLNARKSPIKDPEIEVWRNSRRNIMFVFMVPLNTYPSITPHAQK